MKFRTKTQVTTTYIRGRTSFEKSQKYILFNYIFWFKYVCSSSTK